MFYAITHKTIYEYDAPVSESVMEVRSCPRTGGAQRCWSFALRVQPNAQVYSTLDALGNQVHHFNVPGFHDRLILSIESQVELREFRPIPDQLLPEDWTRIDQHSDRDEVWEMTLPSPYIQFTPALVSFSRQADLDRRSEDPLTWVNRLRMTIAQQFEYVPQSTSVDSPIDVALESRRGVCQDFAHIMIAMCRQVGLPCRYVSGYLFHREDDHDRSQEDATHAWCEAYLPGLGWVGQDPTNDLITADRHIVVAVGRDYQDVPPTRGIYKGDAKSRLNVAVSVAPTENPQLAQPAVTLEWVQAQWKRQSPATVGASPQGGQQ